MDLSVVIPTYNRKDSLAKTLECLSRQEVPRELQWEIVVVDNNCTDGTGEFVANLAKAFPVVLRHIVEVNQGASNARNRGIAEARGEILLFTDDDVKVSEGWVQVIYDTFRSNNCDAVAGKIDLEWNWQRPKWLTDDLLGFLAQLDYGPDECVLVGDDRPPFGPNMAFARSVFNKIEGFDATLGPKPGSLTRNEEPELFKRFINAGLIAVYQPKALVYHRVDRRQIRKSFFRKVHFLSGRDSGRRYENATAKRLVGVPLFLFPQLCRSITDFARNGRAQGFHRSLRKEMNIWFYLGFIVGCVQVVKTR